MAQSDARFDYRAKLARTDHDLSRSFGFTATPGLLIPVFADLATPGDKYYIKHDLTYLRTSQMSAPAMIDVKVHFESFFVPFQMIYEPFENVVYQLNNMRSSLYDVNGLQNINFPVLNYQHLIDDIKREHPRDGLYLRSFRLADMLGLNADNFLTENQTGVQWQHYAPNFFPWQILAYHTIFNYYYRLDDKTQFRNDICNWDKYYNTNTPVVAPVDFFNMHYRAWEFDYFTSNYRSPIVSNANMQQVLTKGSYSWLLDYTKENIKIDSVGNPVSTNAAMRAESMDMPGVQNLLAKDLQAAISTANIRQMFANEKLAMITGRTRKTYDSQVLAHLGVSVPHDVKHDISCIGRSEFDLQIGEVTSLASTELTPLGELAGKGWAKGDGKQFDFEAPCHGVIMTLFSIEPHQRYYGGFDRINQMGNAYDVPTPEFDRLGNVPMFRYELGVSSLDQGYEEIIGWKERYYEYKRRYHRTTLAFSNISQRSAYDVNDYATYMISNMPLAVNTGQLPVTPRPELEDPYYISQDTFNPLMLVPFYSGWKDGTQTVPEGETAENWNNTPWLAYARDPFIVDSYVKVKKVSWMSKDGEPLYNV